MEDCNTGAVNHHEAKEKAMKRLYGLLVLQKEVERQFGDTGYNVFVFESDIFYIDISTEAPIYCVPLNSTVQFTSYYPKRLVDFERSCQQKLKEAKRKVIK